MKYGMMTTSMVLAALLVAGCSDYRDSTEQGVSPDQSTMNNDQQRTNSYDQQRRMNNDQPTMDQRAQMTMDHFKASNPDLNRFWDNAEGYVVFPEVAKGAIGIGGAHGMGVVYEHGHVIGYVTLTQVTIGPQLGGQVYSEVIFLQDAARLADLKNGHVEFDANASAVAASSGAAKSADYKQGVAVFSVLPSGLMFEASIGTQKFSYEPK